MERRYKKLYKEPGHDVQWVTLNRGIKKVNIGQDIYLYGKQKLVNNPDKNKYGYSDKILHMVIYAPERKEYHVYGEDVSNCFGTDDYRENGTVNRHGNKAMQQKVKIYILTSVLDDKNNWCFDLSKKPKNGKLKVIYDNGTVKNIEFNGNFNRHHLHKHNSGDLHKHNSGDLDYDYSYCFVWNNNLCNTDPYTYINPVGYRKF